MIERERKKKRERERERERERVVVVSFGLYVFFHHEGDFKDGGTNEKGSTKFAPTGFEPATLGSLVRRSTT